MQRTPGLTPDEYLAALPIDRRKEMAAVRQVVTRHMPNGYREMHLMGMIAWGIPLSRAILTPYNGHPLCYVTLAAQKNYSSLYLMACYGDSGQLAALRKAFADAGKKLDMGKSCIHFQTADDLPLAAIGKLIAAMSPGKWITIYERSRPDEPRPDRRRWRGRQRPPRPQSGSNRRYGRATGAPSKRRMKSPTARTDAA